MYSGDSLCSTCVTLIRRCHSKAAAPKSVNLVFNPQLLEYLKDSGTKAALMQTHVQLCIFGQENYVCLQGWLHPQEQYLSQLLQPCKSKAPTCYSKGQDTIVWDFRHDVSKQLQCVCPNIQDCKMLGSFRPARPSACYRAADQWHPEQTSERKVTSSKLCVECSRDCQCNSSFYFQRMQVQPSMKRAPMHDLPTWTYANDCNCLLYRSSHAYMHILHLIRLWLKQMQHSSTGAATCCIYAEICHLQCGYVAWLAESVKRVHGDRLAVHIADAHDSTMLLRQKLLA